jgi:DNA primase
MFADRLIGSDHVVVCEGPIDAIKMHKAGGNVATMGKSIGAGQVKTLRDPTRLSREQMSVLSTSGVRKVYLALDPDAVKETARLAREMSDLEVYVIRPPKGAKDIGELSLDEAHQCFLNAEPAGAGKVYIYLGK